VTNVAGLTSSNHWSPATVVRRRAIRDVSNWKPGYGRLRRGRQQAVNGRTYVWQPRLDTAVAVRPSLAATRSMVGGDTFFRTALSRLQNIQRGQDSYKGATGSVAAARFYLDEVLGPAVECARGRSDRPRRPVDLLISLCGFTPTPTILTYELLRPKRMLVVTSQNALDSINVIGPHVVGPGRLEYSEFTHRPVEPTDPLAIYRIVKEELEKSERLDGAGGEQPFAVIDITGGRKVMSAAAALAAWQLRLDLCYLDSEFDTASRHPLPGTDRLIVLSNPTAMFGEQEMARAVAVFRSGAFEAARDRYHEIAESVVEPSLARFMRALADLYRAWCDLDLKALPKMITAVRTMLPPVRNEFTAQTVDTLERQLEYVTRLAAEDQTALLVTFHVLGQHYRRLGRHDFAALLFYRAIEGCLTRRLERRFPGFDANRPDYKVVGDVAAVRQRYAEVATSLGPSGPTSPPQGSGVGLMAAAILLTAERDELALRAGLDDPTTLDDLRGLARMRNQSVLAHGFGSITDAQTKLLQERAEGFLRIYWDLHGDGGDVDELCQSLVFIAPER